MHIRLFIAAAALLVSAEALHASEESCESDLPGWACSGVQLFEGGSAEDKADRWQSPSTYMREDPYKPISTWTVCPPPPPRDYDLDINSDPEDAPLNLTGDSATRLSSETFTLIGNAMAQRGNQQLKADRIIYKEEEGILDLEGDVQFDDPEKSVTANDGRVWINENRGEFRHVSYRFYQRHARGKARKALLLEPGVTEYRKSSYTTCPDGSNVWMINGDKVTLDTNTGVGVARGGRMQVKDVPILYLPYLSFPIDDRRKSGFLAPAFGSSSQSGVELTTPYYFNLAPNYDAIFAPRYLDDRGLQLNGEFRYLSKYSNSILNVEYLNDDKKTGDNRSRITFKDASQFNQHLSTSINYDRVSDEFYLRDLGDSLSLASTTFLPRNGEVNYNTRWWNAGVRVDNYQTIDKTVLPQNRPYERLPRVVLNLFPDPLPMGLDFTLASEAVNFRQNDNVEGKRIDMQPNISLPLYGNAYELIPKAGIRRTSYNLNNQTAGESDDPSRTTPIASLDGTLFFERDLSFGSHNYTQTLEPRAYYLYVQNQNQENLPLFDTGQPTFTYNELFEENRFNGVDRMGDANQTTLALTTRFLDKKTGAEQFRASVGQIYYFKDREVTLNNTPAETENRSDIAAEMQIGISRLWRGHANFVWDPFEEDTQRADATLQYHPAFRTLANVSYRYTKDLQNQIDTSFLWPVNPNWHALGRYYYSIDDAKILERMVGIEYDNCCWGIRLVAREFINSNVITDDAETDTAIMFQFVFKGLAHVGSSIENLLEDGILGYTPRPED